MLPNFYREAVECIALLYAIFLHGGIYGIVAIVAMTENFMMVIRRYL